MRAPVLSVIGPERVLWTMSYVNLTRSFSWALAPVFCVPTMCSKPLISSKTATGSKLEFGWGNGYVASVVNDEPGPGDGGADRRIANELSARTFETTYNTDSAGLPATTSMNSALPVKSSCPQLCVSSIVITGGFPYLGAE